MDLHTIFDVLTILGLFSASWVGLAVKNILNKVETNQSKVKEELLARQVDFDRSITAKHVENRQDLAVHSARDEEQFKNINQRFDYQNVILARIENKLDHNHV